MSYVRIWIHVVWGTKNRLPFFAGMDKIIIYDHMYENAVRQEILLSEINGCNDHVHCLTLLKPNQTEEKIVQLLKGESSYWINRNGILHRKFEWSDEYYAVSIGESQVERVRQYIKNQEKHHQIKSWDEEVKEFMEKYGFDRFMG